MVLLLSLLMLPVCAAEPESQSRNTAMIGTCVYRDWVPAGVGSVGISIFGGIITDTGWVSDLFSWSDTRDGPRMIAGTITNRGYCDDIIDAEDFMREGERVSVYDLEAGVLGEATITKVLGAGREGFMVGAKPRVAPGQEIRFKRVPRLSWQGPDPLMLAVWVQNGGQPGWVTGKVLDPTSRVYRPLVVAWLTARDVPPSLANHVVIKQIVRADINGDGRHEVFLSFHSPEVPVAVNGEASSQSFSYLVMRTVPEQSRDVATVVIDGSPERVHEIRGLCDLDRDGVAEVATEYMPFHHSNAPWGMALFRWAGGAFSQVADEPVVGGC